MFRIELIPALHGDCILIQYGTKAAGYRRVLIDGGPIGAFGAIEARLDQLPEGDRCFDLLVVTHVDGDHIEGIVRFLADHQNQVFFNDVWFNGWKHLVAAKGVLGPVQGEFVSALIERMVDSDRWNSAKPFCKGTIKVGGGQLPTARLKDGMKLTLLSPTEDTLAKLRKEWKKKVEKKGFSPGDLDAALKALREDRRLAPKGLLGGTYQEKGQACKMDDSVANGSSIAFLAEYGGKSCLFLGDAHPDVIAGSLRKFNSGEPVKVNAVKLSHHGSKANTTPELLNLIQCKNYLISTNGAQFDHPDEETLDMICEHAGAGVVLRFNYETKKVKDWESKACKKGLSFKSVYPKKGMEGLIVSL